MNTRIWTMMIAALRSEQDRNEFSHWRNDIYDAACLEDHEAVLELVRIIPIPD